MRHPDLHVLLPEAVDDPHRPSGGNTYDRRACHELARLGWRVVEHHAGGAWPHPSEAAVADLDHRLTSVPGGAVVLVDGLVGSAAPDVLLRHADRLRLVPLVHLPLGVEEPARQPGEKAVLAVARAVVVTSEWSHGWVLHQYGLDPELVAVARPGVDPAPLAKPSPEGARLLCVGAISVVKGHDVLVEAVTQLADLSWRLQVVGSAYVEPDLAAQLRSHVADVGLAGTVTFTGPLVGADLAAAYAGSDLLVLPSRHETYAMVATEALARGLPVVASDTGGVREALDTAADGSRPGLLVPPADPDALAAALRDWLADAALRLRLRAAARSRRETLVGWPATARRLSVVLSGVRDA